MQPYKTESNNISHDVTNNTTNHNGSQSVSTKRELRSGFRWMEGLDRTKDPFEEHFDKTGSIFCQSYFPADELGPEQIGMCGVEIPEDARETIIANPVKYALRAVGREDDQILVRTLKSRQKRLPARFFGAEIVNFISMVFADRMPDRKRYFERFPEKRMRDKGRVLISRLDKAYAVYVGTHGMTQKMDVPYLWAVAEGRETFQKVAA